MMGIKVTGLNRLERELNRMAKKPLSVPGVQEEAKKLVAKKYGVHPSRVRKVRDTPTGAEYTVLEREKWPVEEKPKRNE